VMAQSIDRPVRENKAVVNEAVPPPSSFLPRGQDMSTNMSTTTLSDISSTLLSGRDQDQISGLEMRVRGGEDSSFDLGHTVLLYPSAVVVSECEICLEAVGFGAGGHAGHAKRDLEFSIYNNIFRRGHGQPATLYTGAVDKNSSSKVGRHG
jgi:hypothetical protein